MRLFKKKVKEDVLIEFVYHVYMKDGNSLPCKGMTTDKTNLANRLSDILEDYKNFYVTDIGGKKIILWTEDVSKIIID